DSLASIIQSIEKEWEDKTQTILEHVLEKYRSHIEIIDWTGYTKMQNRILKIMPSLKIENIQKKTLPARIAASPARIVPCIFALFMVSRPLVDLPRLRVSTYHGIRSTIVCLTRKMNRAAENAISIG